MTTTDPNDDRPVLLRALDLAFPIVEADIATTDITAALAAEDADPLRVLAHAFLSAMNRLADRRKTPTAHRCGWCHAAAGGTDEVWRALPSMGDAEIKAHTLVCEHNPLVAIVKAAREALTMFDDPDTKPWWGIEGADARARLRDALTRIGP